MYSSLFPETGVQSMWQSNDATCDVNQDLFIQKRKIKSPVQQEKLDKDQFVSLL